MQPDIPRADPSGSQKITTYLEMTHPDDLRPAPVVPNLSLRYLKSDSPLVRSAHARVGEPYGWPEATWSEDRWDEHMAAHPLRQHWLITYEGEPAGICYFEPQTDATIEITAFGLLPAFVGRGLGGYALTLALRQAWATRPIDAEVARRVWLHTWTEDHPHALANYRKRGMRPYKTEQH